MTRLHWLGWTLAVAGGLALAGCKAEGIEPLPGKMLSTCILLKTTRVPLTGRIELRRYEMFDSKITNDFYPHNLGLATPIGPCESKLYVYGWGGWSFIDFAEMPLADTFVAPYVSSDGKHILYDQPDVSEGEGNYPWVHTHDRRVHRAALYDLNTKQKYVMDQYAEVGGLGVANFWRPDSEAVAFTTTIASAKPMSRGLVVLEPCGNMILDYTILPDMAGLEFICWSPDGNKIAALRTASANAAGCTIVPDPSVQVVASGAVVEVDVQRHTFRDVGTITTAVGSKVPNRYDRLVKWDKGNLVVRE